MLNCLRVISQSATGALRLYHGVRAYADVAEHFFDKRRQGSYGPRAHDARVTHPPLCASTLPPYEIRVAMRNAWRRCFPVLADVRNCKEPSALWIVAELSSGVLLQEILVTGSQVGDHGFHCPCSPCVASVARHPTAEAICSHLASRMLAEPRGFSLGTLDVRSPSSPGAPALVLTVSASMRPARAGMLSSLARDQAMDTRMGRAENDGPHP